MATLKWEPAGTAPRSLLFLTATVVAALFAGLTVASGSRYLAWMDERARRLAIERDQQATIAAAAERTRIARELHDIVSHSLSVVITLADAAAVVSRSDPGREAMAEVSEAGRQALSDMRAMLGVLRTDDPPADLAPQPGVAQLGGLHRAGPGDRAGGGLRRRGHPVPARRRGRADRVPHRPGGADQHDPPCRRPAGPGHSSAMTRRRVQVRVADDGTAAATGRAARARHRRDARAGRPARRHRQRRPRARTEAGSSRPPCGRTAGPAVAT